MYVDVIETHIKVTRNNYILFILTLQSVEDARVIASESLAWGSANT